MSSASSDRVAASIGRYASNCGWLLLPALLWNVALAHKLPNVFSPAVFWHDVPWPLALAENGLRIGVFALPFFMPLSLAQPSGRRGLGIYAAGTLVCFASWLALILRPASSWSQSVLGLAAPAYTPLLWLLGIALIGRQLFWGTFFRWWMYLALALAFLVTHVAHVAMVVTRPA